MKLLDLKKSFRKVIRFYTIKHKVYGAGSNYLYGDMYDNENKQLIRILHKITPIIKKHPEFFIDKSVLDFGCGTGEHTYFLSNYVDTIDCFDPQIIHYNWLNTMFKSSNTINVLKNKEYLEKHYDTIIIIGVLQCIEDYKLWLLNFIDTMHFDRLIICFSSGKEYSHINSGRSLRNTRLYDNNMNDNTIYEEEVFKSTYKLKLLDSYYENVPSSSINPRSFKKCVHFYQR